MSKVKVRQHNEYFRTVKAGRKRCPTCKSKLDGEPIWSWGEYIYGRWNTVKHFCKYCAEPMVLIPLRDHAGDCGCQVNLVGYCGEKLPEWLTIETVCEVTV